jgi:hypothetical protein
VPPSPVTVTTVGRDVSASAGIVITVASSKLAYAWALTRSDGIKLRPGRPPDRSAVDILTSGAGSTSTVTWPAGAGGLSVCSPRSRRSGVKRHSSSRPPGTAKSAGS